MAIPEVKSYTKTYDAFRGVDFSTDPTQVADARSPYAVNLVSDLAGFPEKRLGWRTLATLVDERINGLFYVVLRPKLTPSSSTRAKISINGLAMTTSRC